MVRLQGSRSVPAMVISFAERYLAPPVAACCLIVAVVMFMPALRDLTGHGTRGTFTARTFVCRQEPNCGWVGDFVSTDKHKRRRNVMLVGSKWDPDVFEGAEVAAIDTGRPGGVYRVGRTDVLEIVIRLVFPAIVLLVRSAFAWRKWRRSGG